MGGAQEDDTLGGVGAEDAHLALDGADVHRLQVDAADHLRAYEVVGSVEGGDLRRRFLQPDFGAEVDGDRIGGMACFLVFGDGHHGAHPHFHFVKVCYFYHIVSFKSVVSAASTNRVLRGSDAPQKTAMCIIFSLKYKHLYDIDMRHLLLENNKLNYLPSHIQ